MCEALSLCLEHSAAEWGRGVSVQNWRVECQSRFWKDGYLIQFSFIFTRRLTPSCFCWTGSLFCSFISKKMLNLETGKRTKNNFFPYLSNWGQKSQLHRINLPATRASVPNVHIHIYYLTPQYCLHTQVTCENTHAHASLNTRNRCNTTHQRMTDFRPIVSTTLAFGWVLWSKTVVWKWRWFLKLYFKYTGSKL